MNTLKSVSQKISKIEKEETKLASHKVDLALADDIKSSLSQYKGLKDNVDKAKNAAKNAVIKYIDSTRAAYQNSKTTVDLITELENKAKQLGLGDTGYEGWKKEAVIKTKEYQTLLNSIDSIYKSIQ